MKRKMLLAALVVFFKVSYGQYDYFKWSKAHNYNASVNAKVPGSGMTADQYDRIFYVTPAGGNFRVFWPFGDLLGNAANAASTTNMKHIADASGDHLFYITSNNRIGLTEYLYSNQNWSYNGNYAVTEPIAPGPSIAPENMGKVYYIRASDNKVCNYYTNQNGSGFSPVIASAPAAAAMSNLVLNNDRVFYITSNRQIGCLQFTWLNGWQSITLPNGPPVNSIAPGSKIQVRGNLNSFAVFFITSNNDIYQYTNNPSYSGCDLISSGAVPPMAGTDIITYSHDEVRYVGVDGNVQVLYANECGWSHHTLNNTCSIADPSLIGGTGNNLFFYSNTTNAFYRLSNQSGSSGFVYKKGNRLMLNNMPFNAIGMNYMANIYSSDGGTTFFPGPDGHYNNNSFATNAFYDQSSCQTAFDLHLAEIASLGFNSIRFNDFHIISNPNNHSDPNLYITYWDPAIWWQPQPMKLLDQQTINSLFVMYDYVLNRAANYNLKVKFFIGLEDGHKNTSCLATYNNYLQQFASYFNSNNTIYSYAILQEADNNPSFAGKGDICYYVEDLYDAIRANDLNHLVNLSVMNSDCVRSFDPAILKVDFMSFHLYPNVSDPTHQNLKRELQWTSTVMKSIGKPWIIGETGFPGNHNNPPIAGTGSYADQSAYAQFILDEGFASGASGVCWWQYKGVYWPGCCSDPYLTASHPNINNWSNADNYFGIKAHDGSLKPAAYVFQDYVPQLGCSPTQPPTDYYNLLEGANFHFSGGVFNQHGEPIKDAQIIAMDFRKDVEKEQKFTFSNPDGSFSLQTNQAVISAVFITAPGYVTEPVFPPFNVNSIVLTPVVCGQGNARVMTSLEDEKSEIESKFLLYPNPNNGIFTITNKAVSGGISIEVTDVMGRSVMKKAVHKSEDEKIDLSSFNNGVYFVQIISGDFVEVKKVIKK